jgi:hypothetical protein
MRKPTMDLSPAPSNHVAVLIRSCLGDTGVDGAGLSVVTATGAREALFVSDPLAAEVEHLQFTLGEGPCVDATSSGTPVLVDDLDANSDQLSVRWPMFVREATRAGVRAIFAFPVLVGAVSLGAVDLYRRTPGALSRPQLSSALTSADAIGWAVLDSDAAPGDQLLGATSLVVHQAAGMVMVQLDCAIEEALVRLRATAFADGVTINKLAADVVHGRRRLTKEM